MSDYDARHGPEAPELATASYIYKYRIHKHIYARYICRAIVYDYFALELDITNFTCHFHCPLLYLTKRHRAIFCLLLYVISFIAFCSLFLIGFNLVTDL